MALRAFIRDALTIHAYGLRHNVSALATKKTMDELDNSLISNYNDVMIDNVLALISAIRDRANRFLTERMERHGLHGLVTSHGNILYNLFIHKEMSMKELSRVTGKDKSTVTALVNKLHPDHALEIRRRHACH